MRLFLAVDIDDRVRRHVSDAVARLRRECGKASAALSRAARWVVPDNLHVTLHFLGEVDRARVPALLTALGKPILLNPFDLVFGGAGIFPSGSRPRVIWLDVVAGRDGLSSIHAELGNRLESEHFEVEKRPFAAHLTLARLKSPVESDLGPAFKAAVIGNSPAVRVDHLTLYSSQLSPAGPTYSSIARTTLEP